jgi:hypothetical protein
MKQANNVADEHAHRNHGLPLTAAGIGKRFALAMSSESFV